MTRINTNVSSLVAQFNLQNSNNALQTSLTRLSTGLRINSGADDPAGLIQSQTLGSEITSINASLSNAQQASDIVSTADAALAQVSSQLNSIRGLVQQAANKGAISSSEIASDQQQVDSSLQAIQQIAQTTIFGDQNLLNGSMAFNVNATGGSLGAFQSSSDINIASFNPALHGSAPASDVSIHVTTAATKKTVVLTGDNYTLGGSSSLNNLSSNSTRATSTLLAANYAAGATTGLNHLSTNSTNATATISGAGLATLQDGTGQVTLQITGDLGTATTAAVSVTAIQADSSALTDAINAIATQTGVTASGTGAGNDISLTSAFVGSGATLTVAGTDTDGGAHAAADQTALTGSIGATTAGTDGAAKSTVFTVTGNKGSADITLANNDNVINGDLSSLVSAINGAEASTGVTAAVNGSGNLVLTSGGVGSSSQANIVVKAGGNAGDIALVAGATKTNVAGTDGAATTTTVELIGDLGRAVVTFNNDAVINNSTALVNAINSVSTQTGIAASSAGGNGADVTLTSQNYGSAAVVTANAIAADNAGDIGVFNAGGTQTATAGVDVAGTVTTSLGSGAFSGTGANISYQDSNISLTGTTDPSLGTLTANFNVTGGALFQIGPQVNYQNQVNVSLGSLDLTTLGRNFTTTGNAGLSSLQSGGANQLSSSNLTNAAALVDQAINQVATLRGQLGALQTNVLDSNIQSLQTNLEQVTTAQSDIQDANFASETANLTRAQILVQAGTSVLSIANSRPQSVLSLLPH